VVENSSLRPIAGANDFESLGYKWANILTINPKILELYNVGESLKATATS
jgi:hypothetical protein